MIMNVARPAHIVLTTVVAVAVLVIFISPLTDILPAPQLKHTPAADLFASALLLAFMFFVRLMCPVALGHPADEPPQQGSERLELICTLRR